MKTKKALFFAVIALMQFHAAFGQYNTNFQGVYPVENWNLLTTNYTITPAFDKSGCVLVTNPGTKLEEETILLLLKMRSDLLTVQTQKCFVAVYQNSKVGIVTKDVITTKDSGYVSCGNISMGTTKYAYIAKFDRNFNPIWGKVYTSVSLLNSICEIKTTIDIPYKFIAVGGINIPFAAPNFGVILCIDEFGNPLWQDNTSGIVAGDNFIYNQVVPYYTKSSIYPDFAIVGNSISTNANKDIVVTRIGILGNNKFSMVYGYQNNSQSYIEEEGYGIAIKNEKEALICGKTKRYNNSGSVQDNMLLFSIDMNSHNINWQKNYNLVGNRHKGTFAQSIRINAQGLILINGYFYSNKFNPNGSYDSFFLTQLDSNVNFEQVTFGSGGDDRMYRMIENEKGDGVTNAGYSSSFGNYAGSVSYAPYIYEHYYQMPSNFCFDQINHTTSYAINMPSYPITLNSVNYLNAPLSFIEYDLIVGDSIPCPKTLSDNKNMSTNKHSISEIDVYPISDSYLQISGINNVIDYKIYNIDGIVLNSGTITGNTLLNISAFKPGIYIINIGNEYKKFIKSSNH